MVISQRVIAWNMPAFLQFTRSPQVSCFVSRTDCTLQNKAQARHDSASFCFRGPFRIEMSSPFATKERSSRSKQHGETIALPEESRPKWWPFAGPPYLSRGHAGDLNAYERRGMGHSQMAGDAESPAEDFLKLWWLVCQIKALHVYSKEHILVRICVFLIYDRILCIND